MSNFSKRLKTVLAKVKFLPFIFVALFLLSFGVTLFYPNSQVEVLASPILAENGEYSQEYQDYINLSDEEKEGLIIPRKYDVNPQSLYSTSAYKLLSSSALPESYCLYDLSSNITNFANTYTYENLKKNVGDQDKSGICWSFATLTALESTLYKSGIVSNSETLNFSELNMAYVTRAVNRGFSSIDGGNFEIAYEYLSSEQGPYYEGVGEGYCESSSMYWSDSALIKDFYANNYYNNAVKSQYRAYEAVQYPSVYDFDTTAEKTALRNSIKNHIKTYGGVTAGIYGSGNFVDNYKYIVTDPSGLNINHMVTLVGWDDNFTLDVITSSGTITYTGAYLAQNSWGEDWGRGGYFYIMYNDAFVESEVCGFSRVGIETEEDDLTYNNYVSNTPIIDTTSECRLTIYSQTVTDAKYVNIYDCQDIPNQYITKIKVGTVNYFGETKFKAYLLNNLTSDEVGDLNAIPTTLASKIDSATPIKNYKATGADEYLFTANQYGYFTIEVKDQLNLVGDYFAIVFEIVDGEILCAPNASSFSVPSYLTFRTVQGDAWRPSCVYLQNPTTGEIFEGSSQEHRSVLPMVVQTEYRLGQLEYTASGFDGEYSKNSRTISLDVTTDIDYSVEYSLTGEDGSWTTTQPKFKDAGNYKIYYKIEAEFYETVVDYVEINIAKKELVVVPRSGQTKYYGDDELLSYDLDGLVERENPTRTNPISRQPGEDVGKYVITMGDLIISSSSSFNINNYTVVFSQTAVEFEILPRVLYVTPDRITKTYGEVDPELTYVFSNMVEGETPKSEGTLSRQEGDDSASYNILINNLTLVDNENFKATNYTLQIVSNLDKFLIYQRTITVTPDDDQQKPFATPNEVDPEFTYTWSGETSGETAAFSGALTRATGEESGEYEILQGTLKLVNSGDFKASNYKIKFITGVKFSITLGALTGCYVNDVAVSYTGREYYLTPNCTDFTDVEYHFSEDNHTWLETLTYKNAGEYTVYVKAKKPNYSACYMEAKIIISKINLTVTPKTGQSKIYGEDDTQLLVSYAGNIEGEDPIFSGSLARAAGNNVGEYLISQGDIGLVDNSSFLASNYNLVFENPTNIKFVIEKRTITAIPVENQNSIYGKDEPEINYTFSGQVAGESPKFAGLLSREDKKNKNVGEYLILQGTLSLTDYGSFLASNHNLVFDNSREIKFAILKTDITIVVDDKTSVYTENGENVITDFTYHISPETIENYVSSDEFEITYTCSVTKQSQKGEYAISAVAEHPNYNITVVNGTYTVTFKTFTVSFKVLNEIVFETQVEHFSKVKQDEVPVVDQEGYTFTNWRIEFSNGSTLNNVNPANYSIVEDTTFVAGMEVNIYTITYNLNGGRFEGNKLEEFNYLTPTYELLSPVKTGYNFGGWYESGDFNEESKITHIEQYTARNITVYAKWIIKEYSATLPELITDSYVLNYADDLTTIKYNSSFEFVVTLKLAYSQSVSTIKAYVTWQESQQTEEVLLNELNRYEVKNVNDNFTIELTGININVYNIYFMANGDEVGVVQKEYGSNLTKSDCPDIPDQPNYDQKEPEWETTYIEGIKEDHIINATYTPNVYTVTFKMFDGRTYQVAVTYGEEVDTEVLKEHYNLNIFEYFVYSSPIDFISKDATVSVEVKSNIYILYIVLGSLAAITILVVVSRILKRRKRKKFNWWMYADEKDVRHGGSHKDK